MKALEARVAQEGLILTESQLQALEKHKDQKEAHGEIETVHPGYLGSQDTYYVGTFKGIGRVYQEKTALTAADILNDRVLLWYEEQGISVLRILTDRGTEYSGKIETHAYQLFLSIEDIDHSRTKAYHPQTNGICERFHKTMKTEFYDTAFRKKTYTSLEELQIDVDHWIREYNEERPHSGKYCYGKTPLQTFRDAKYVALEKNNQAMYSEGVSDSHNLYDNQIG